MNFFVGQSAAQLFPVIYRLGAVFIHLVDSGQMVRTERPAWRAPCCCTGQSIVYQPNDKLNIIGNRPEYQACQKQVR
jgi:hypothetical protein